MEIHTSAITSNLSSNHSPNTTTRERVLYMSPGHYIPVIAPPVGPLATWSPLWSEAVMKRAMDVREGDWVWIEEEEEKEGEETEGVCRGEARPGEVS